MKEQYMHIDADGDKFYYSDREMTILHREDGPAIERANGSKAWYINGERHRDWGPAVERANGYKTWYINGERLTEEEFNARNRFEVTLEEIAEKFGVSVNQLKIKK